MTKRITIFTRAIVAAEHAHAWLQHLRDFDVAHPDSHFEVLVDAPDAPLAEVIGFLRVSPELPTRAVIRVDD